MILVTMGIIPLTGLSITCNFARLTICSLLQHVDNYEVPLDSSAISMHPSDHIDMHESMQSGIHWHSTQKPHTLYHRKLSGLLADQVPCHAR